MSTLAPSLPLIIPAGSPPGSSSPDAGVPDELGAMSYDPRTQCVDVPAAHLRAAADELDGRDSAPRRRGLGALLAPASMEVWGSLLAVLGFFLLVAWLASLSGCASHLVVRSDATYTAEVLASQARQTEAAAALLTAAREAAQAGNPAWCAELAKPALLIEAKAAPQAHRALWLARLPYPGGPEGEQPDPGPGGEPRAAAEWCAEVVPVSTSAAPEEVSHGE